MLAQRLPKIPYRLNLFREAMILPVAPGDRTSEVEEYLESGGTFLILIEEVKDTSGGAVPVIRLLHGEHSGQLLPTDVHVEGIGLDTADTIMSRSRCLHALPLLAP